MGIYGVYIWYIWDHYGYKGVNISIYGVNMGIYGCVWVYMGIYGYEWEYMEYKWGIYEYTFKIIKDIGHKYGKKLPNSTNFDRGNYPQKTQFERCTAQKFAQTSSRVVMNCARGGVFFRVTASRAFWPLASPFA